MKLDMMTSVNPTRDRVKTPITFIIGGIANKNTSDRFSTQLVRRIYCKGKHSQPNTHKRP